jgi:hypothetical protein
MAKKKTEAKTKKSDRLSWLDKTANTPMIDEQARRLDSFVSAMADGKVDADEVAAQEKRLVKIMKEVEPLLDDKIHGMVTQLLCELTAYDLMQTLHAMQAARPKTVFRG